MYTLVYYNILQTVYTLKQTVNHKYLLCITYSWQHTNLNCKFDKQPPKTQLTQLNWNRGGQAWVGLEQKIKVSGAKAGQVC